MNVSFPFCRARLKIRLSVVSSRLISPFENLRSFRSSPSPDTITSACRFRMNVLMSGVLIVARRRPPKCGNRCSRIRRSSSSAERRPLTAYSVFRSSAASSKRIRFSFGSTGSPFSISPSRILSSRLATRSFVLCDDSRMPRPLR